MRNKAIQNLYPNVSFIIGRDGIFDINHNPVVVNENLIEEEVNKLYAQVPMRLLRIERNRLLQETDWRFRSDLTPSQAWYEYCQALRDLPANSDPQLDEFGQLTNVTWPEKPE